MKDIAAVFEAVERAAKRADERAEKYDDSLTPEERLQECVFELMAERETDRVTLSDFRDHARNYALYNFRFPNFQEMTFYLEGVGFTVEQVGRTRFITL